MLLPNIKKEAENDDDTVKAEVDEEYEAIFDTMPTVGEEEEKVSKKRKVASDKKKRKKVSNGIK